MDVLADLPSLQQLATAQRVFVADVTRVVQQIVWPTTEPPHTIRCSTLNLQQLSSISVHSNDDVVCLLALYLLRHRPHLVAFTELADEKVLRELVGRWEGLGLVPVGRYGCVARGTGSGFQGRAEVYGMLYDTHQLQLVDAVLPCCGCGEGHRPCLVGVFSVASVPFVAATAHVENTRVREVLSCFAAQTQYMTLGGGLEKDTLLFDVLLGDFNASYTSTRRSRFRDLSALPYDAVLKGTAHSTMSHSRSSLDNILFLLQDEQGVSNLTPDTDHGHGHECVTALPAPNRLGRVDSGRDSFLSDHRMVSGCFQFHRVAAANCVAVFRGRGRGQSKSSSDPDSPHVPVSWPNCVSVFVH